MPAKSDKSLCFVVGPIGRETTDERRHADLMLNSIIKPALQKREFGYRVMRADDDTTPGIISDHIIRNLVFAPLVVADLSGLNANVFYALGIRHAALEPCIHIAAVGTTLPFDNAQYRTIFIDLSDWQSQEKGRNDLIGAVRSIKDERYRVRNPITHADVPALLRHREQSPEENRETPNNVSVGGGLAVEA